MSLEEYQAALDLIMHRYRLQVLQMVQMNKIQTITDQAVVALQVTLDSARNLPEILVFGQFFVFLERFSWRRP